MTEENAALIRDLQSLIDFLGAHPELPLPKSFDFNVYDFAAEDLNCVKDVAKSLGTFDKDIRDRLFVLKKLFGKVSLRFVFYRDSVCAKRVVGKQTETKMVPEAGAKMVPQVVETEIVEWDCPSLLDETDEATAPPTKAGDDDIPF